MVCMCVCVKVEPCQIYKKTCFTLHNRLSGSLVVLLFML